jgi:hypothetical protein
MNYLDALRTMHDSTAEHFLYFGLGFSASALLFAALFIGFALGQYRKRNHNKSEVRHINPV